MFHKRLGVLSLELVIALLAVVGILAHLVMRFALEASHHLSYLPLLFVLVIGGGLLVWELARNALRGEFGSDLLAGISIITSLILDEYLAGALVVLMLSGGEALEEYAVGRASSVLAALAKRMPSRARRKTGDTLSEIDVSEIQIDDALVVLPHDICPVDGVVVEGSSVMDESFLTGEPFMIAKVPGSEVISGSINGDGAITIRATKLPVDSRYAKIMEVMKRAEQDRPRMRRLADTLGAWYTPLALVIAGAAWFFSGEAIRFLAVLVVATPCPLLIAIPVAIIGSISLAAKRGIIIRDPSVLEQVSSCQTIILDKTGTLTYGAPAVTEILVAPPFSQEEVLQSIASLEQYSKHPLAQSVLNSATERSLPLLPVTEMSEKPGQGLTGTVAGRKVEITSRKKVLAGGLMKESVLPPSTSGMECLVLLEGAFAGLLRFHDAPRRDSLSFVSHLKPRHAVDRVLIVSGDRESEVRYLAEKVGISEVYSSQSPEQKVTKVREETSRAKTIFIGDGINDAPALASATVGIAFGQQSDITSEAAGAVILDTSLEKVDELFHISARMRTIALQSAVGGILLSVVGMGLAASGALTPVYGAVAQEVIDLLAVLNALRAAVMPRHLADIDRGQG